MARWRPGFFHLAIALALAVGGVCLLVVLWTAPDPQARPALDPVPVPASAAPASSVAVAGPKNPNASAAAPRAPEGDADPTRDLRSYVARGENPTMGEVIERLHERGIHTGLGAFSPPGTRPHLVGLAVPEDFKLPDGYVRHHQATDDGQRIEAVLMFAPDFQLHDAAGKPVAMPKDRVVPPELAPPGLPVRRIAIPPPIPPSSQGR
jgi:hypothetical protein